MSKFMGHSSGSDVIYVSVLGFLSDVILSYSHDRMVGFSPCMAIVLIKGQMVWIEGHVTWMGNYRGDGGN